MDSNNDIKRYLSVGVALERAAEELPEGYVLTIDVEKDASTVTLFIPSMSDCEDGQSVDDWGGEPFGTQINMAIDHAIGHHRTHAV